jgi:hypothetical protein
MSGSASLAVDIGQLRFEGIRGYAQNLQPQPLASKRRSRAATATHSCQQQLCKSSGPAPPYRERRPDDFVPVALHHAAMTLSARSFDFSSQPVEIADSSFLGFLLHQSFVGLRSNFSFIPSSDKISNSTTAFVTISGSDLLRHP